MEFKAVSQGLSNCLCPVRRSSNRAVVIRCRTPKILFTLLFVIAITGCNGWPWREGAVPDSVAMCRQLSQQAIARIEADQWQEAEGLLDRAVTACPIDPDARRYYAETLLHRGASADALDHLEQAIRLTPNDTSLVIRAGEICFQMGDYDNARRWANEAINIDPSSADSWALSGLIYRVQDNPRRSLADFQRALGYRPEDPNLLVAVAEIYMSLGRPGRALLHLQNLSETYVSGDVPPAILARKADALTALGRHQEAATQYRMLCQQAQPSADVYYRLAQAELRAGEVQGAKIATEMALQVDPAHPLSVQLLGQLPPDSNVPQGHLDAVPKK